MQSPGRRSRLSSDWVVSSYEIAGHFHCKAKLKKRARSARRTHRHMSVSMSLLCVMCCGDTLLLRHTNPCRARPHHQAWPLLLLSSTLCAWTHGS